jgi:hypothetical protein
MFSFRKPQKKMEMQTRTAGKWRTSSSPASEANEVPNSAQCSLL